MINFPDTPEPGKHYIESDCGRYVIARYKLGEKMKYRLWQKAGNRPLGTFNSAESAKEFLK